MPTGGSAPPDLLLDTSAAVALVVADHENHESTFGALAHRRLGLAGHAAFETFSVLTRLPPPTRRTPASVARLLARSFPHSRFLGADATRSLFERLASLGIAGGAIYDALVGATAAHHGRRLLTADRRAAPVYRALGVPVIFLGNS